MRKNGFAFIETIITVVILCAALMYLYNSYSSAIGDENIRLYYEDVAFIYKTNYVRKFLETHTDVDSIKSYAFVDSYIVTIGTGYTSMFNETQKSTGMIESLNNIVQSFNINRMMLIDSSMFDDCVEDTVKCNASVEDLSYNLKSYVNTLNDTDYEYYLVIEYAEMLDDSGNIVKCTPGNDTKCNTYYASLGF